MDNNEQEQVNFWLSEEGQKLVRAAYPEGVACFGKSSPFMPDQRDVACWALMKDDLRKAAGLPPGATLVLQMDDTADGKQPWQVAVVLGGRGDTHLMLQVYEFQDIPADTAEKALLLMRAELHNLEGETP